MGKKIESISIKTVTKVLLVIFGVQGLIMITAALLSGIAGPPLIDLFMRILFISMGPSLIISTIGLLKLKKWARFLTMVNATVLLTLTVFLAVVGLVGLIVKPPEHIFFSLISSVFPLTYVLFLIFLIYYLSRLKIKEQFK